MNATNAHSNSAADAWSVLWQRFAKERSKLVQFEQQLSYRFAAPHLLYEALTHRSAVNQPGLPWNEKMEFLGDAVLSLAISSLLWRQFDSLNEGALSRLRASLVSEARLAEVARRIALHEVLVLGKSVTQGGEAPLPDSLLADALEAVFAAVYLDGGFSAAQTVIEGIFTPYLPQSLSQLDRDYKTALQEWAQAHLGETPVYRLNAEEGPPHAREFVLSVLLQNQPLAQGRGASKKQASQQAAFQALQQIADGAFKKKKKRFSS